MSHMKKPPALATLTAKDNVGSGKNDSNHNSETNPSAQAVSINMLRQAIADDVEMHIAQLDAAVAMAAAGSNAGLLHGLRRADAFWKSIRLNARDLASKTGARS
jgi:hypothetical protein